MLSMVGINTIFPMRLILIDLYAFFAVRVMGFESTLCQKAVGKFGDNMEAAIEWLEAEAAIAGKSSAKATSGADKSALNAPDPALASNLAAMGFAYDDALHALRETSNDVDAAVQRLTEGQKAKEEQGKTSPNDGDSSKRSPDADEAPKMMNETKEREKKKREERERNIVLLGVF